MDSEAKPGIFLPPAMRGGNRRGETMMPSARKDETTIRVSNLPESMSETDMQELCNPFGKVERIFLAKDRYALHEHAMACTVDLRLNVFNYMFSLNIPIGPPEFAKDLHLSPIKCVRMLLELSAVSVAMAMIISYSTWNGANRRKNRSLLILIPKNDFDFRTSQH